MESFEKSRCPGLTLNQVSISGGGTPVFFKSLELLQGATEVEYHCTRKPFMLAEPGVWVQGKYSLFSFLSIKWDLEYLPRKVVAGAQPLLSSIP